MSGCEAGLFQYANPTASSTGVSRLTITFFPMAGIRAGTFSEFFSTLRMICSANTVVSRASRVKSGSRPNATPRMITR